MLVICVISVMQQNNYEIMYFNNSLFQNYTCCSRYFSITCYKLTKFVDSRLWLIFQQTVARYLAAVWTAQPNFRISSGTLLACQLTFHLGIHSMLNSNKAAWTLWGPFLLRDKTALWDTLNRLEATLVFDERENYIVMRYVRNLIFCMSVFMGFFEIVSFCFGNFCLELGFRLLKCLHRKNYSFGLGVYLYRVFHDETYVYIFKMV